MAELGSRKKELIPTDEREALTFLAINPDLPTPEQTTLPFALWIISTAFTKFLLKTLLIFFNSLICIAADFLATLM